MDNLINGLTLTTSQSDEIEQHRVHYEQELKNYRDAGTWLLGKGLTSGKLGAEVRSRAVRIKTALGDIYRLKARVITERRNGETSDWFTRARQSNIRDVEA